MRSRTKPPLIKPGASVILVGNGPSLLHSEKGAEIDTFREVFRFNQYRCEGFEKHTGSKTTVYCTFGMGTLPNDTRQRPERILLTHFASKPEYPGRWIYQIEKEFIKKLRAEVIKGTTYEYKKMLPSSGFLVTRWLLDTGQVECLTLAGFDHFQKHTDKRHHYWMKGNHIMPKEHNGDFERDSLSKYEKAGRVKYL